MKKVILFSVFALSVVMAEAKTPAVKKNLKTSKIESCTTRSSYKGYSFSVITNTCAEGMALFRAWRAGIK